MVGPSRLEQVSEVNRLSARFRETAVTAEHLSQYVLCRKSVIFTSFVFTIALPLNCVVVRKTKHTQISSIQTLAHNMLYLALIFLTVSIIIVDLRSQGISY